MQGSSFMCPPFSTSNGKKKTAFIARGRNNQILNISKRDINIYSSNFKSLWTIESLKVGNLKILVKKCLNCRMREKQMPDQ